MTRAEINILIDTGCYHLLNVAAASLFAVALSVYITRTVITAPFRAIARGLG